MFGRRSVEERVREELQYKEQKEVARQLQDAANALMRKERIESGKRKVTVGDKSGWMARWEYEFDTFHNAYDAAREAMRTGWLEHGNEYVNVRDACRISVETYDGDSA